MKPTTVKILTLVNVEHLAAPPHVWEKMTKPERREAMLGLVDSGRIAPPRLCRACRNLGAYICVSSGWDLLGPKGCDFFRSPETKNG